MDVRECNYRGAYLGPRVGQSIALVLVRIRAATSVQCDGETLVCGGWTRRCRRYRRVIRVKDMDCHVGGSAVYGSVINGQLVHQVGLLYSVDEIGCGEGGSRHGIVGQRDNCIARLKRCAPGVVHLSPCVCKRIEVRIHAETVERHVSKGRATRFAYSSLGSNGVDVVHKTRVRYGRLFDHDYYLVRRAIFRRETGAMFCNNEGKRI